ncbi:hypothetical protein [Caballeronia sp. dw_276]|uniref:hypothetical protein n=1 Tax=Caballeronia sp. dw_276 TaxID=2719795 RepID=UPI001BD492D5|nr:hypothetical protein [Caballeronia sp. dw_276]
MQGAGASIDDVRVVVQALYNWFGQIRSNEVHLLKIKLNAVLDYATRMPDSDELLRNELCIARSLLALNQVVFALQRLEKAVLPEKQI